MGHYYECTAKPLEKKFTEKVNSMIEAATTSLREKYKGYEQDVVLKKSMYREQGEFINVFIDKLRHEGRADEKHWSMARDLVPAEILGENWLRKTAEKLVQEKREERSPRRRRENVRKFLTFSPEEILKEVWGTFPAWARRNIVMEYHKSRLSAYQLIWVNDPISRSTFSEAYCYGCREVLHAIDEALRKRGINPEVVYGDGGHRADKGREVWDWLTTKVELPCSHREQIESLSADVGLKHAHECAVRKIEDDGSEVIFEFHNGEVVALEYPGYVLLSKGDKEKWTPVTFRQLQSIIAEEERGTAGINTTALQAADLFTKAQAEPQKARFGGCFDKGINKYRACFRTYWYKKDA